MINIFKKEKNEVVLTRQMQHHKNGHWQVTTLFLEKFVEVNKITMNPKSSPIWKSILIKRQFVLGTSTDLFKMIPSKLFDEESRLKLIDFLILKKLLVKGD
jgi:hypothetical protein